MTVHPAIPFCCGVERPQGRIIADVIRGSGSVQHREYKEEEQPP